MSRSGAELAGLGLHAGDAVGALLVLAQPLSFYGGVNAEGVISAALHPQCGESLAGRIVAIPASRGSSSSASVLAELMNAHRSPGALLMVDFDSILVGGAIVGRELYDISMPIVRISEATFWNLGSGGLRVEVRTAGQPAKLSRL